MIALELERVKYLGKREKELQIKQYSEFSFLILLQSIL